MAITPYWHSGFEHGLMQTGGNGIIDALSATQPTVISGAARTGGYGLRVAPAAQTSNARVQAPASQKIHVSRVYLRLNSTPAADSIVLSLAAVGGGNTKAAKIIFSQATGVFSAQIGAGTAILGPAWAANVWYRVEFRFDLTNATWTMDWMVDGVAQTQAVLTAQATTDTQNQFAFGTTASSTFSCDYDDVCLSVATADYPIGPGYGTFVVPTSDGTHSPATPDCIEDSTATLISGGNPAWSKLDDIPMPAPTASTDLIRQITLHSSDYVEVNLGNITENYVNSVRGLVERHVTTAATAVIKARTVGAGAGTTDIAASGTSLTVAQYVGAIITAPGGGWTKATVNELVGRIGFSTDVTPVPIVTAFMLEVDVREEKTGAAALTGAGTLAATGVNTRFGAAALTGAGSLAAAGIGGYTSAAALTGAGSLSATGVNTRLGVAALTGSGSLSATGVNTRFGSGALTGTGSLSASGIATFFGAAGLTGTGSLSASGASGFVGSAALTGTGSLSATGEASGGEEPVPTQVARPRLDVGIGGWTNSDDGTDNLWSFIDEAAPADGDYIQSDLPPTAEPYVAKLSNVQDPGVDTGYSWSIRYGKPAGDQIDLLVELRQGYASEADQGTLIKAVTLTDIPEAWTQDDVALSEVEASAITDHQNLYLRVVASIVEDATPSRAYVSWFSLGLPFPTIPAPGPSHTYADYRIAVYEVDGAEVIHNLPYIAGSLQYTETLNEPSTQVFACSPDKVSFEDMAPGSREVRIYRDDALVAAGDLLGAQYGNGARVEFACKGFARRLYRRLITETQIFVEEDLVSIAWELIDWANGIFDTGIERDPSSTPLPPEPGDDMLRSMTFNWYDFQPIGNVLDEFVMRAKGFDWEVTPDKMWKAYHHRKGVDLDPDLFAFERGRNITQLSMDVDASETTTKLWVLGFGSGEDMHIAVAEDLDGQDLYGFLENTYSRTQPGWVPFLQGVANRKLENDFRDVRVQPDLKVMMEDPVFGAYFVGDTVQVNYDRGWVQIDGLYRIMSQTIHQEKSGAETAELKFDAHLVQIPESEEPSPPEIS